MDALCYCCKQKGHIINNCKKMPRMIVKPSYKEINENL
jgi:hypothetical protein